MRQAHQHIGVKTLQILRVAVGKADQVVVRASDIEAVQYLGLVANRLLERFELSGVHALQVDDGEAGAVPPHRRRVHQRDVLRNHAAHFQSLHAAQTG